MVSADSSGDSWWLLQRNDDAGPSRNNLINNHFSVEVCRTKSKLTENIELNWAY